MQRFLNIVYATIAVLLYGPPVNAWPFVDEVVSYNPGAGQWQGVYRDQSRVLGPPHGSAGAPFAPDNSSVVTLGDGGNITVRFNDPIFDDPRNPYGLDFIVFSNAIWTTADGVTRWQEPAFVEVSDDNVNWYLIQPNILPANLKGAPQTGQDTGTSSTILRGYAEHTPTLPLPSPPAYIRPEEFYTVPDRPSYAGDTASLLIDSGSGGGDAIDIAQAVLESSPGVPILDSFGKPIPANLSRITYVRLTDALVGDTEGVLGEISAEIDAVAAVMPVIQPLSLAVREQSGRIVRVTDAVVARTNGLAGSYVHSIDGTMGTFVSGLVSFVPGSKLKIIGYIYHDSDGDRIGSIFADKTGNGPPPKPVVVSIADLVAPNRISPAGMYIKVCGRVRYAASPSQFWLEDVEGSKVLVKSSFARPTNGSLAIVTACSRKGTSGVALYVQEPSDINEIAPPLH